MIDGEEGNLGNGEDEPMGWWGQDYRMDEPGEIGCVPQKDFREKKRLQNGTIGRKGEGDLTKRRSGIRRERIEGEVKEAEISYGLRNQTEARSK